MAMDWFRSWHNAPTDPKWLVIAQRARTEGVTPGMVSAVAWALMDYASQNADRGSVEGFDAETYAAFTGWYEDQIEAVIEAMRSKGMITPDGRLAAWDKRQPKREDSSTERVRRHRAAKSVTNALPDSDDDVTPSNAMKHDVTQSNPRLDETRPDETREEKNGSGSGAPQLSDLWRIYSERFSERFGHMPPGVVIGDNGDFMALVDRGLTLAQIDAGITDSLETFKPSPHNEYPKSWRYCLPAIARTLEPKPVRTNNGYRRGGVDDATLDRLMQEALQNG